MKIRLLLLAIIVSSQLSACSPINVWLADPQKNVVLPDPIPSKSRWWKAFNDPLMNDLADELLRQNIDIQSAIQRLAQARGVLRSDNSAFFPIISALAMGTRGNTNTAATNTLVQGDINATWQIDLFGQIREQVKADKYQVEANKASVKDVANSVLAQLFTTIINWRQTLEYVKTTAVQYRNQQKLVALYVTQFKAGLIDETFLESAKRDANITAALLAVTQTGVASAQYQMEVLLRKPPGTLTEFLKKYVANLSLPDPKEVVEIKIDVICQRPDVQAARAAMLSAQASLAKAEADLWPNITLGALYGVQYGSKGLALANPIWSISSAITAPLLNFGLLQGKIDVANALSKQAALNYERTVLNALQEAQTQLRNYLLGINSVNQLEHAVKHDKKAVEVASKRYKSGLTNMIDLMNAKIQLERTELLLIQQKATTASAYISLQKALSLEFYEASEKNVPQQTLPYPTFQKKLPVPM